MRTRTVLLMVTGVLAAAAACSSIAGNDDDNFSFISMAVTYDSTMVDSAAVNTQLRNLLIDGLFVLPHPCHQLRGDYRRQGGDILFTTSAVATNPACPLENAAVEYHVNTFGAASGTYRVRVYHNLTGTAPRLVKETTITLN